jgi:hypothetical protein
MNECNFGVCCVCQKCEHFAQREKKISKGQNNLSSFFFIDLPPISPQHRSLPFLHSRKLPLPLSIWYSCVLFFTFPVSFYKRERRFFKKVKSIPEEPQYTHTHSRSISTSANMCDYFGVICLFVCFSLSLTPVHPSLFPPPSINSVRSIIIANLFQSDSSFPFCFWIFQFLNPSATPFLITKV